MKSYFNYIILLLLTSSVNILTGQVLQTEPYLFISKNADTVESEVCRFTVPENRSDPSSKEISLTFVRFKSTNPNPSYPIIYLAGGPGGSGIEAVRGKRFELFMKLRQVADVIALDQRGTGQSNTLPKCPYYVRFETSKPIHKEEYVSETSENIIECLRFWEQQQIDIYAYNTTESAKDIEDLRKAIGADKISLWGISYGSHLAFEYIRNYESNIHKVVLASLEGPGETIKLPNDTESFLDHLCQLAATNYGYEPKYPDLKNVIKTVHLQFDEESVITSFTNRKGEVDTVGISNYELKAVVANFYLKNPEQSKKLPALYYKLLHGDYTEIAPKVKMMKRYAGGIKPMSFAMDMSSGISDDRNELVKKQLQTTTLGGAINQLYFEWMNTLPFKFLPDSFRTLSDNEVEALLLSGSMDGRTYANSAKNIAKHFKNGKHIIVENAGHDLFMSSPVISELIPDFLSGKKIVRDSLQISPTAFE